jgi:hypothetical protein
MHPGAGETAPCRKCVSLTSGRAVRCTADDVPPRRAGAESTWPPRQAAAQASACHGGRERNSRLVCSSSQNPCTGDRAAGRIPAGSRPAGHQLSRAPGRSSTPACRIRSITLARRHRHPAGLLAVFEQFRSRWSSCLGHTAVSSSRARRQPRGCGATPRWPRSASQCGPGQEPAARRPPEARLPTTRPGPASCPLVNCRSERPRARSRARLIGAGST